MNPSKIGPREPSIELTIFKIEMSEEIQAKKTTLKDPAIPPISSGLHQSFPDNVQVHSVQIVSPELPLKQTDAALANEISQQLSAVERHLEPPSKPVNHIVLERAKKELDKLVEKKERRETIEDHVDAVIEAIQIPTEVLHVFATEPYDNIEPFLGLNEEAKSHVEKMIAPVEMTRTVLQGIELVGNGAALIVQAAHFQEAKNFLQQKEIHLKKNPSDENLKSQVAKLRNYLAVEWDIMKDKMVNFAGSFSSVILKTTSFALETTKGFLLAKGLVGWSLSFIDVLWEAIALWRSHKAKTTQEAWMEHIAKDHRSSAQAQELLAKRQERMILHKVEHLSPVELKDILEKKGVDLKEKNVITLENFRTQLAGAAFRSEVAKKLLDEEDEKEDTINVMTRNALQALGEAKVKNEKKFFDFKLIRSKLNLTLECLCTALTITLEVLAFAGVIAASASLLSMPWLGFFVLGLAVTSVGLYFFYKHKPNLFKCFVKGVNIRIAFLQIPAKIRSLQLSRVKSKVHALELINARYERLEGLLRQKEILDKVNYPKKLQNVLEKLHRETSKKIADFEQLGETEKLNKYIQGLESKKREASRKLRKVRQTEGVIKQKMEFCTGQNSNLKKLQDRLKEAGNKDFARANHLVTTAQNEKINIPAVIIEKILDPKFNYKFDEETLNIFEKKMGIDIKQVLTRGGNVNKEKIIERLKDFFKMDDADLLNFMKQKLYDLEMARNLKWREQRA